MAERVEIIISATDNASKTFRGVADSAQKAFTGVGKSIQNAGKGISSFGRSLTLLTAPLLAFGVQGTRVFSDFETVLAEIEARTGATGEQMDAVKKKALDMGAATAFSGTEAANAMLELLASGFSLEETFTALPAVLNAAAAGNLELGYTADVVTDALAMFNLAAEDSTRVVDALSAGAGASSADIDSLAQGLGNVGPIAAEFNLSIEDTVGILAAFSERGIKGAEAGTQLKSMLVSMTKTTPKVTGMWESLGIELFTATGAMRPLETIMNELSVAMDGMSDKERINTLKTLGGSYGQLGLSVLTSSDAMGDMNTLMAKQTDAATVAAARMDTLAGRTESFTGSIETLMINVLGPHIEDVVKPFIVQMTELVNGINEWVATNPELTSQIVKVSAALIALGPIMFGTGKGIELVGTLMIGWGKTAGTLIKLIPLLISPLGLLGIAAVGLVVAWKKNLFGIQDFINNALIPFQSWIDVFVAKFEQLGKSLMSGDLEGAMTWASEILDTFVLFLNMEILPSIQGWANEMIAVMTQWIQDAAPVIMAHLLTFGDTIINWLAETVPVISAKLLSWAAVFVDWVTPFIPPLLAKLGDLASSLISWLGKQAPKIVAQLMLWGLAFIAWVKPQIPILLKKLADLATAAKKWVGDQIPGIIDQLKLWGAAFVDWVIPALADLILELPSLLFGLLIWILEVTPDIIAKLLFWAAAFVDWVGPTIQILIEKLGVLLGEVINWIIVELIPAILAEGPGITDALLKFVEESITKVGPALLNFLRSILAFIVTDLVPGVWNAAKFIGDQIVDGIEKGIDAAWDAFEKWVTDKITGGIIGDVIGGISDALGFDIPGYADGGSFSGLGVVGEHGQELVYAPGGAMVIPNGQSEGIINNFNLTTNSAATSAGVESDFRMMEAFAG